MTKPYKTVRKKCEGCGEIFAMRKRVQRFHSKKCHGAWKKRQPEYREQMVRFARESAAKRRKKNSEMWESRILQRLGPKATLLDAYRLGRVDHYRLHWMRVARASFAKGVSWRLGEHAEPYHKSRALKETA